MATNKRNELTLQKKIELIKNSSGQSQRQLAEKYNIGKTHVQSILKRKAEYLDAFEENRQGTERGIAIQTNIIF